jgi:hypothetical protein
MLGNLLRKSFVPLGFAALVLAILSVAPKAAHAVAAALVQVVNTSANPVPNADVNAPFEEPFQASLCYGTTLCSGSQFYQIPVTTADNLTIKQAVVTTISGLCVGESSSLMFPQITSTAGGFVFLPLSPAGQNESVSTVSTKMYFPPQSYIEFNLNNNYGGGSPACSLSVMGYYLTH